jgi:hypothetical protein
MRFAEPIDYSASNLTKLSPTIEIGHRHIVVSPKESEVNALEIIGIWDPGLTPHYDITMYPQWAIGFVIPPPNYPGISLTVNGPGWIRVKTAGKYFYELRNSRIYIPYGPSVLNHVIQWFGEAEAPFGPNLPITGAFLKTGIVRRTWLSILRKACNARHGGCFLVIPNGSDVSTQARIKYPLNSTLIQDTLRERLACEPALFSYMPGKAEIDPAILHRGHFCERQVARMCDHVASLASVDGSVVIQRDLRILGFGAEILNTAAPAGNETAETRDWPTGEPTYQPVNRFGMRHRSAYRFCQGMPSSIAFVISQDGDLRIFDSLEGKARLFERVTPDDSYGFLLKPSQLPNAPFFPIERQ